MAAARGLLVAVVLFVASFALHIVAGASGLGWLFAVAVALIFLTATGLPAVALLAAGARPATRAGRLVLVAGSLVGVVLTASALWAANGRTFAWWEVPASVGLVALSSALLLAARSRGVPGHRAARRAVVAARPGTEPEAM